MDTHIPHRNSLVDIGYCTLTSGLAFIFVPVLMMGARPEQFDFLDFPVFFQSAFMFSGLLTLLLSALCLLLALLRLRELSRFLAVFLAVWVLLAGFVLPVSSSAGMTAPENTSVSTANLILVALLSLAGAVLGMTRFARHVVFFIGFVAITGTAPAAYSLYSSDVWRLASHQKHPSLEISSRKNILVVSFDGMPGHIVTDLIERNERYTTGLKDFVVFRNVVSQSPSTDGSMLGEIFGVRDFSSLGGSVSEVLKGLGEDGSVARLPLNRVEDSYTRGYSVLSGKKMALRGSDNVDAKVSDTIDYFRYPLVRLWTRFVLSHFGWSHVATYAEELSMREARTDDLVSKLRNHKGENWDRKHILELYYYQDFVERLSAGDKRFSVRYLHFTFTHFPVDFDSQCNYRSDDATWYWANQNEAGLTKQSGCALSLFLGLLDRLKALAVYENSLIVFKSDHGEPSDYFSSEPYNLRLNGSNRWGYSRYRPTLMIKDFGANRDAPAYRSELVLLNDLARTLCRKYEHPDDCEAYGGLDLLSKEIESDGSYHLYVAKNSDSDFRYSTHMPVVIPSRKLSLLEAMKRSSRIELVSPAEQPGKEMNKRLEHLEQVGRALAAYYDAHGTYPKSHQWDGVHSDFGSSIRDYISGLAPEFLTSLPTDPRGTSDGSKNYLYKSNGTDFKFIVHGAPRYDLKHIEQSLRDVVRPQDAYGIWSSGGKYW